MDLRLQGKKAVVVGASRGLGLAVAVQLAAEGARVAVVGRSMAELPPEAAATGKIYTADLLEDGAPEKFAESVISGFGAPDIVVHNLGGSLKLTDHFAHASDYARVWRLNLGVAVTLNNIFIPHMEQRGWGRVVHVSSVSAENYTGATAYVAAKGAVNAYVKSLSRILAPKNIVVSAINPGPLFRKGSYYSELQTTGADEWNEFTKHHLAIGRLAKPEEVAPQIVLLCSELASYSAGTIVNVDGGSH